MPLVPPSSSSRALLAALAALLTAPVGTAQRDRDPALEILKGVEEIAAPGVPGEVCAFGPEAFVLVAGRGGVPVVAAARSGRGGALVFGHNGYLSAGSLGSADTGTLLRNAVRWLAGGKRSPRVLCPGNAGLAEAVGELGLRASAEGDLRGADVLVGPRSGGLGPRRIEELRAFMEEGGVLVLAETGWGWQQLNSGRILARDLASNRLLAPIGLAFGLGTVGKTAEAGYSTRPPPDPLCHAGRALEALLAGGLEGASRELAIGRIAAALACLPDYEPRLILPLRALLEEQAAGRGSASLPQRLVERWSARDWRPLAERWGPWRTIGPFSFPGGGREIATVKPVERTLEDLVAGGAGPDLSSAFSSGGRKIRWQPLNVAGDGLDLDVGEVRLDEILAPPEPEPGWERRQVAYLWRRVEVEGDSEHLLCVEADDGVRLWVNGELVVDRPEPRPEGAGEADTSLFLRAGTNHLLVKVANGEGLWKFRLRRASALSQQAIHAAIDRGVAWLLERQRVDGSWDREPHYGVGFSALAVYTLLKSGVGRDHPAVRRGMAFVRAGPAHHTYGLSCKILALSSFLEEGGASGELRDATEELVDWQEASGLYAYPLYPGGARLPDDLSNTLYAALALRAAAKRGVEVPPRTWEKLVRGALLCASKEEAGSGRGRRPAPRGFGYRQAAAARGSTTTAGLTVLLAAREALEDRLGRRELREIDTAVEQGLAWLDENMTWTENPGATRWHYFFIYGVERLGALLGAQVLGRVNWYWSGAEYLVEVQGEKGDWSGGEGAVDTCLALLFLNRATAPESGRASRFKVPAFAMEEPDPEILLRATGRNPLVVWVAGYSRDIVDRFAPRRSRSPRVAEVSWLARRVDEAEERVLARIEALPETDGLPQRFEARLAFDEPGEYEVRARVDFLEPASEPGLEPQRVPIESGVLRVEVGQVVTEEVLGYARDPERNRLRGEGVQVSASSQEGQQAPGQALDGSYSSVWRCAAGDAAPWWKAALRRPIEARRVLFTHAASRRMDAKEPQVARIEVLLDGQRRFQLELHPDPMRKTALELPEGTSFSTIEVRLLDARNRGASSLGFAEIEVMEAP